MQGDENIQESAASVETSSPAVESSVSPATESSSSSEATASESSGETKESLLDAVLKTVNVTDEQNVEKTQAEDKPTEIKPEEEILTKTTSRVAIRLIPWRQRRQRRPLKRKLRKLQKEALKYKRELENVRPSAEIGQQLQNYATTNNLSSEDVVFALDLASMVGRGDYEGFYKVISPLVRHAQEVSGVVLPPDVQQMVEQQQMTPQAAAEYAKARFERANFEARASRMEQQQQHHQVSAMKDDVQRAVSAFEQRLAAQDPDYKAKAAAVRRAAQAMLLERGGRIASTNEALQITQAAYNEVNQTFRRIQQPVRATAPTPGSANPQTPTARPAPRSLMEAAMQGLERSRRAM